MQSLIADDLSQIKLFPNTLWTLPDGSQLVEWVFALRGLPSSTPGLKNLRIAFQQIGADLTLLTPVTDDEEEERFEPITDTDFLQDAPEEPSGPPAPIQVDTPSAVDDAVDKGKQRAAAPSLEPEAAIEEAAKLIAVETQKELAGRKVLEQQNLILYNPGVSQPFPSPFSFTNFLSLFSANAASSVITSAPSVLLASRKGSAFAASLASG